MRTCKGKAQICRHPRSYRIGDAQSVRKSVVYVFCGLMTEIWERFYSEMQTCSVMLLVNYDDLVVDFEEKDLDLVSDIGTIGCFGAVAFGK